MKQRLQVDISIANSVAAAAAQVPAAAVAQLAPLRAQSSDPQANARSDERLLESIVRAAKARAHSRGAPLQKPPASAQGWAL